MDFLSLQNGSDIRGIALEGVENEHVNLTWEKCNIIAQSYAFWLSEKLQKNIVDLKIGVGRDSRLSGEDLADATMQGLASCDVCIFDCKMATTPSMFMSTVFDETKFDGAVMITASHLPFNRNGIKFFDKDGCLEKEDITKILQDSSKYSKKLVSLKICEFDLLKVYSEYLTKKIKEGIEDKTEKPLSNLKIVVDAGNGAAGFFADVLKNLGADTTGSQFLNPDGNFPNHIPNPENKQAMESIKNAVLKNNANLGLIFDTDVDRMSAVLSSGEEVNRDEIIALMSAILAPKYPNSTIITDSVTSDRLTSFLESLGLKHHRFVRGYKNVINECKRLNEQGIVSPLAMETSGHGALKDNFYLDDGAFLAVELIIALANANNSGKNLASLIKNMDKKVEDEEIRFKIKDKDFKTYGDKVLRDFKTRAQNVGYTLPHTFEGVRISFDEDYVQGWLLLRQSLHEPVLPMNIEGKRKGDVKKIEEIAFRLLQGFEELEY